MDIFTSLLISSSAVFVFVTVGFVISRIIRRNDIADILWGLGVFLAGGSVFLLQPEKTLLPALLFVLIGIWALRLSGRIFLRNIQKSEDARYTKMSASWGRWFFLRSYLQVFLLQGFLMILVGYPLIHASVFGIETAFGIFAGIGILIWIIGFFFEAVGDFQLDTFLKKSENRGKVMRYGLWRYTRHPNYFGEVTQWWGIWIMLLSVPFGFFAILSPLLITFLILKVSGIPMLEKAFEDNPEFQEYKKTTSAFFPTFPRRKA